MKVIRVAGRKGGSGKTTTAVHLAAELASRGRSVVLINADSQGSANHWATPGALPMPVQHRPLSPGDAVRTWSKAIRDLNADLVVVDSAPHLDAGMALRSA